MLERLISDLKSLGLKGLGDFYHNYERAHRLQTLKKANQTGNSYVLLHTTPQPIGQITEKTVQVSRLWAQGYRKLSAKVAKGEISAQEAKKYGISN